MSNLKLQWMYDELKDAGVNVRAAEDWESRTYTANTYLPAAVLNHHTAGASLLVNYPDPPYWPDHRLWDRCNITIRPDGGVVVLNAGYAYDSGEGDDLVLARVVADGPILNPQDFTKEHRINGNPYFIDIEVQHVGDGSSIAPVQREALIETNAVLLAHYDWDPMTRLLGHREWTRRKVDPRWNGMSNPMHTIRLDTEGRMNMNLVIQARIDVASGVFARTLNWMEPVAIAQERLTRLANEVVAGRPLQDVLQHFGVPKFNVNEAVPAWVLTPTLPAVPLHIVSDGNGVPSGTRFTATVV